MDRYIVIIGDIVDSKDLNPDERKETQKILENCFDKFNTEPDRLMSAYTITLGDEFQAVYSSAGQLFRHIWTVMAQIHPVRVRIAVSLGEISTEINREQSLGMDGPAFHLARDRINEMKKNTLILSLVSGDDRFDRLVNSSFRILTGNLKRWNKNRYTILQKRYEDVEVKQIARDLGLSEVAVYKNINAGTLDAIRDLTDSISETLNEMASS